MLYLAPHIAKVTLVAYECNAIPQMLPSRWDYRTFADCPSDTATDLSFWDIVRAVQLESFLWGLGTAIGELPPYFISRAARRSGKKPEGFEDFTGFWGMLKRGIYLSVKKYAFVTVLLCASIPNPLFDLAGLLCGHFGVNFWVFFGATFIGKAFFKVHIQMLFTILLFSEKHLETLLTIIQAHFPSLQSSLSHFLANQKKSLHSPQFPENKALVAKLWELFILCMVAFFLVSILNSLVQNELVSDRQERETGKGEMEVAPVRVNNTNSKAK